MSRPKCYSFDTGFVTHEKGWDTIRSEDRGILWEHLIYDSLLSQFRQEQIRYWKDKSNRELDFVVQIAENEFHAIECKVDPDAFTSKSLTAFRARYPSGRNFVVSPFTMREYSRNIDGLKVTFLRDVTQILDTERQ